MSLILSGTDGLSDVDGSAATPAIRGTDANTGIFFPAADTIAFAEGGAEAMRIDSSGNVGIGQTAQVWDEKLGIRLATSGGGAVGLGIYSASNAYTSSVIRVQAETSGTGWKMFEGRGAGGAQLFYVDGSGGGYFAGNVGIGTTTASAGGLLTLNKSPVAAFGNPILQLGGASFTSGGYYSMGMGFTDATYTEPPAEIAYVSTSDSGGTKGAIVFANRDVTTNTAASERARINTTGAFLVNTTSATGSSQFVVAADTTSTNVMTVSNTRSTASTDYSILFYRNGSIVGSVQTTLSATSFVTSSDYRLKEDIQPMTGALAKVAQLNPVTYKWKLDGTEAQGFIAHELQAIVPDCVTGIKDEVETYTDEDGNEQTRPKYQGIDTSFLVATLTAAIKEQQALITALTARITALETQSTDNPSQGATP